MADFAALGALLTGTLHVPADAEFLPSTSGFNLAIEHAPDAVALVADADDVAHVVRFARDNGLTVSVQATGHGAESPISDPSLFAGPVPAAFDELLAAVDPWHAAEVNINFVGVPRDGRTARSWSEATLARLNSVRGAYDPSGVFAS